MKRIIASLLIALFCAVSFGQERRKSAPSMSTEFGSNQSTSVAYLRRPENNTVPLGVSQEDYAKFYALWTRNDKKGMQDAMDDEICFPVDSNTRVKQLDSDTYETKGGQLQLVQVRILSGENKGKVGWTDRRFLAYEEQVYKEEKKAEKAEEVPSLNPIPKVGEQGQLTVRLQNIPVFQYLHELTKIMESSAVGDAYGFVQNVYSSDVNMVPQLTKVLVIESTYSYVHEKRMNFVKVRILEGDYKGSAGYIYSDWVHRY